MNSVFQSSLLFLLLIQFFSRYMTAGTLLKNYTEVLAILTRLRQLCCHPKLCTAALEAAAKEGVFDYFSFDSFLISYCYQKRELQLGSL